METKKEREKVYVVLRILRRRDFTYKLDYDKFNVGLIVNHVYINQTDEQFELLAAAIQAYSSLANYANLPIKIRLVERD